MTTETNYYQKEFLNVVGPNVEKHIDSTRFPFTYHHDWYRSSTPSLSRGDVAELLRINYPDRQEYDKQAVNGALAYLFENVPEAFLNDILDSSDEEQSRLIILYSDMKKRANEANRT